MKFFRSTRARTLATSTALILAGTIGVQAIDITNTAAGNWTNTGIWSPAQFPVIDDRALFSLATGVIVSLNGNQAAQGLAFSHTSGTYSVRATAAGQILTLGALGITYGSGQVDIGSSGTQATVFSLAASQAWTGSGTNLIQVNVNATSTTQTITNGTAVPVTLTFDGVGAGAKTIFGAIDDGVLGGTTAITVNTTGTSGAVNLNGTNLYTGGTTLTQGFLGLNSATALGATAGALTINGAALSATVFRTISSSVVGGVTLSNNNPKAWNGDFTLGGAQSINFGTGAVTLGANRTIFQVPAGTTGTTATNYTEGGDISGTGFSLSMTTQPAGATGYTPGINSLLNLTGTNTYTGGTNITFGLVRFGSAASIPGTGQVVLNGGALSVSGAFTTLASVAANTSVTRTTGALALTANSSEAFTAPNANISLGAALGSVVNYTGTITPSGNNYNLGGGGGTIVFSNNNAFTGARSITTNGGTQGTTNGGGGTVIITGQNSNTGNGGTGVNVGMGTLEVSSINRVVGGTATSNLGAPTLAANGTINFGASGSYSQLRYTGAGETTDRNLNWAGFSGANAGFDASGTGAVIFTGAYSTANSASKNLTLRGINTGANTITAGIGTQVVNPGSNTLSKQQRGAWTLSGSNNFTALTVNGGSLTADYANVATVFTTSTPTLTLGGGGLAIKGNAAGTTAQTLGNPTLSTNSGASQVTVTGNGTAGSAILTLGNTWTRNTGSFLNINLVDGGRLTSSPSAPSGVVVGSGTLAAFTVTDSTGTDYATVTGGNIARLGAPTGALPASGSVNTGNYSLSGDLTLAAVDLVNSLRIDTSSAGGTLSLNGFGITPTLGTILKDGANDYNITGTGTPRLAGAANATIVLSTFGTGALNIAAAVVDGSGNLFKTGPGLVNLTAAQAHTGTTTILGGVLRLANATFGTSNITLNTGGILEIGADLNGATAGDFSRTLNTGGSSQINWTNGDGGFSAFGANRTVSLTNALNVANGPLVWGSTSGNNFVTASNASPAFVRDGFALLLSSSTSNATLDFTNPIDLVNLPRTVEVGNGSAPKDAKLSGILSSSDFSGGLHKSGAGTLEVSAANIYTGPTRVVAGAIDLSGSINATNAVNVTNGTVLLSGSTNGAINDTAPVTLDNATLMTSGTSSEFVGVSSATATAAGLGALTLSTTSTIDFGAGASTLWFSNLAGITGTLNIVNWNGDAASGGGTDQLRFTINPNDAFLSQISFGGSPAGEIFFSNDGNPYYEIVPVPEPSSTALIGATALMGLVGLRERRRMLSSQARPIA